MDDGEIKILKVAAEKRYRERLAEVERDHASDLDAILRVARLTNESQKQGKIDISSDRTFAHGDLQRLVDAAVANCTKSKFSAGTIEDAIRMSQPEINGMLTRKSVSGVLKKLAQEGQIPVIRPGRGRRETLYGKPKGGGA
ncbi:MAG: hypothetical protein HYR83_07030 [Planctomycetes bacterium]|nr:hypothetical protein [Planctomycetota bacterium]